MSETEVKAMTIEWMIQNETDERVKAILTQPIVREALELYVYTENYPKVFKLMGDVVRRHKDSELSDLVAEYLVDCDNHDDEKKTREIYAINTINDSYHDNEITGSVAKLLIDLGTKMPTGVVRLGLRKSAKTVESKEHYKNLISLIRSNTTENKLNSLGAFFFNSYEQFEDAELLGSLLNMLNEFDKNVNSGNLTYALESMLHKGVTKDQLDKVYDVLSKHIKHNKNFNHIVSFMKNIAGKIDNNYCIDLIDDLIPLADYVNLPKFLESLNDDLGNIIRINDDNETSITFPSSSELISTKTFISPDVIKLIRSYDEDFDDKNTSRTLKTHFQNNISAITYTSAVCRDQKIVDQLAKVLSATKEHNQYSKMVAILSNIPYNLRNPETTKSVINLFDLYKDSPTFDVMTKAAHRQICKAIMTDEGIRLQIPFVQSQVNHLASPKIKSYIESICEKDGVKNLISLAGDCGTYDLDVDNTLKLISNLINYSENPHFNFITRSTRKSLKQAYESEQDILQHTNEICNKLSLPNINRLFTERKINVYKPVNYALSSAIAWTNQEATEALSGCFIEYAHKDLPLRDDQKERKQTLIYLGEIINEKIRREKNKDDNSERLMRTIEILNSLVDHVGLFEPHNYGRDFIGEAIPITAVVTEDQELTNTVLNHYLKLNEDENESFAVSFSDHVASTLEKLSKESRVVKKKEIARIVIEDSIKYEDQWSLNYISIAVRRTVEQFGSLEVTQEVADIIDKYRGMKGLKEVADTFREIANELELDKMESFCEAVQGKKFEDVVILYQEKSDSVVKYAVGAMTELASWVLEMGELDLMSKILKKYHKHSNIEQIVKVFYDLIPELEGSEDYFTFNDIKNFVDNCPEKHNIQANIVKTYFEDIYSEISDHKLRNHLPMKTVNNLLQAYNLSIGVTTEWSPGAQQQAKDGFLYTMNEKAKLGDTIEDKNRILNEWSTNASQAIRSNASDLKFMQTSEQHLSEVNVA
jgi:hypothetical protein